ncbi:hypothetical protein LCGC14_0862270 [marine sediment metagenome]|uniref:Uncharacterized protein n=1 Tax=marine sediment metagenome TaxID=412755 RepID=A0A0F9PSK6_9ZZZZ
MGLSMGDLLLDSERKVLSAFEAILAEDYEETRKANRKFFIDVLKACKASEERLLARFSEQLDGLERRLELLENPDKLCSLEDMREISS